MRASTLPVLLLTVALSGCLGGTKVAPTTSPALTSPYDVTQPFTVSLNATRCSAGAAVYLADPPQAQKSLPPGFRTRDAGGLLGTPETGKAAILLEAWDCAQTVLDPQGIATGEVSIYVEPPQVPGERPAATDHFYYHSLYTSSEPFLELLLAANVTHAEGTVRLQMTPQAGGGSQGGGNVADPELTLFTIGFNAPAAQELDTTARFWHVTKHGLAYFDYRLKAAASAGTGSCTARAGSSVATALGVTNCPTGSAVGLAIAQTDWSASFHHLPGAKAS